jgi:hypothetical protein
VDRSVGRHFWSDAYAFARIIRGDEGKVGYDQHVVFGDSEVQFENIRSVLNGIFKGRDGIFRARCTGAAVAVNQNGLGMGKRHNEYGKANNEQTTQHGRRIFQACAAMM